MIGDVILMTFVMEVFSACFFVCYDRKVQKSRHYI